MANVTYTVKKGDTLSSIAVQFNTTVSKLVDLNNIQNPDFIVVGQELIVSGTKATPKTNNSQKAKIDVFGLQANTDRTVYATWTWSKKNTENYEVKWLYSTGDGVGFIGDKTTVDDKQSVYTAPDNATHVSFSVKPISKKRKVNNEETDYWTASWSNTERYYFKDNPPITPDIPTVSIESYKLTAELDNLNVNADSIEFQVVRDDRVYYKKGTAKIVKNHASYSCTVDAGKEYTVRCRSIRGNLKSPWSEYSEGYKTIPAAPENILELRALSETSVYLDWSKVSTADSYEIEYVDKKSRFDSSNQTQSLTVESVVSHAEIDGLESGKEWFFRVRAVNEEGESGWTAIKSVKIGKPPIAPTTWSSTTTVKTGEALTLYWVHNTEDGSSQTYAELEMIINGVKSVQTIKNSTDEDEKDKTSFYSINTTQYSEGTTIQWRVRTRGILATYGEWSIQRKVDIYAPPSLAISVMNLSGDVIDTLESFPFRISATAGPNTQTPIGYHVSIRATEGYETVDSIGNVKMVKTGDEVYSKYYDITDPLLLELSAGSLDLENNVTYTVVCTVSMNSGLTAEDSASFTVSWGDDENWPDAEIGYDSETYTTMIRPYCVDGDGNQLTNVLLSVYRREFDGSYTELAVDLDGEKDTFITDPHPALDYARYRIVSKTKDTGAISYYDVPGYPVGEIAAIIQWDEAWTNFDTTSEDELEQPVWSGSLLRLPYNIDVSDEHDVDVELVEYIGRKHPVGYYGTQVGATSTWNVEIERDDEETLYALRRLAIWLGDVYVREPSGSGYWANVSVSFSQKHCEVTIPVTLSITRVEGGA